MFTGIVEDVGKIEKKILQKTGEYLIRIKCNTEETSILLLTFTYLSLYGSDISATLVKPEPDRRPIISKTLP